MSARSQTAWAAVTVPIALLGGCTEEAQQLPPFGEAIVVVDTDAPVPSLVSSLRVDIFTLSGEWLVSEDIFRGDPRTWPVSFSIYTEDEAEGREVLLRLRAYPDGKIRDYRGDRFSPPTAVTDSLDSCVSAAETTDNVLLLRDEELQPIVDEGGDPIVVTPLEEPLPNLTIDRLVHVRVEPGVAGVMPITLKSVCFGSEANLVGRQTCIDTEKTYVPVEAQSPDPDAKSSTVSVQSTYPDVAECGRAAEAAAPFEPVCVPGGMFELGDPSVFGFGQFDGIPERVAAIPTLWVSPHEVTVAQFREVVSAGGLDGEDLPTINNGPLAEGFADAVEQQCTYRTSANPSRDAYPVNCVSWTTARAFCQAVGGDLPTEAQWEYWAAAAGRPTQERYPWGSTPPTCDTAVFARSDTPVLGAIDCIAGGFGVQPAVGDASASKDRTPVYELSGLAGNVGEWVLDSYRAYCSSCWDAASISDPLCNDSMATHRTIRGGDWANGADSLLSGIRDEGLAESDRTSRVGFRCVWENNAK